MFGNTVIYLTDQRQKVIANNISGKKVTVNRVGKINWEKVRRVILPTPVSKFDMDSFEGGLLKVNLAEYKPTVYGGAFGDSFKNWLTENEISYVDMALDEMVIDQNAEITAEAVIGLITTNSNYSIKDSKIILTGFGHCSKALAVRLLDLGAKVTVLARSKQSRIGAAGLGCFASPFAYGPDEAYGTAVLINTVPALVVTDKIIKELQKDALIIDIASGPGGCDKKFIEEMGLCFIHALGLPGKYMTASSGRILANCINKHTLSETNNLVVDFSVEASGEDETWIYQIVP